MIYDFNDFRFLTENETTMTNLRQMIYGSTVYDDKQLLKTYDNIFNEVYVTLDKACSLIPFLRKYRDRLNDQYFSLIDKRPFSCIWQGSMVGNEVVPAMERLSIKLNTCGLLCSLGFIVLSIVFLSKCYLTSLCESIPILSAIAALSLLVISSISLIPILAICFNVKLLNKCENRKSNLIFCVAMLTLAMVCTWITLKIPDVYLQMNLPLDPSFNFLRFVLAYGVYHICYGFTADILLFILTRDDWLYVKRTGIFVYFRVQEGQVCFKPGNSIKVSTSRFTLDVIKDYHLDLRSDVINLKDKGHDCFTVKYDEIEYLEIIGEDPASHGARKCIGYKNKSYQMLK